VTSGLPAVLPLQQHLTAPSSLPPSCQWEWPPSPCTDHLYNATLSPTPGTYFDVISASLVLTISRLASICVLFASYTLGSVNRATQAAPTNVRHLPRLPSHRSPIMIRVIPLNQAPRYVSVHSRTPNLIESTRSSTRNSLLSSTTAALMWATATSDTSLTLFWGSDTSSSRNSLKRKKQLKINNAPSPLQNQRRPKLFFCRVIINVFNIIVGCDLFLYADLPLLLHL
jgi:hypothetical protein